MKFHWGHGVAILYCSFVVFMLFLVYKSSSEDIGLVTKEYYKDEIEYDRQIDKIKNSAALAEKLNIEFLPDKSIVRFHFPKNLAPVNGRILFYRPSDSEKDLIVNIEPNTENIQDVSFGELQKGLWRVRIDWQSGGKEYYDEKPLVIQ